MSNEKTNSDAAQAPIAINVRNALVSLECAAQWLERDCDPKAAAEEIRSVMAMLRADPVAPAAAAPSNAKLKEILDWIVGMSTDAPITNMARRALELVSDAPTPTVAADAAKQASWISVADRMPASGRTVLATYLNSAGKSRRIRAQYIAAKTRESNGEDGDLEFEYDEGADTYYWPAGWYECVDNWSDLTHLMVSEGDITHWTDMPPAPGEPNASPVTALTITQGAAQ